MQWLTKDEAKVWDSQSPNRLNFRGVCPLVPHQGSALDSLLIFPRLLLEKRSSAFYKLNLKNKNGVITKSLEKILQSLIKRANCK